MVWSLNPQNRRGGTLLKDGLGASRMDLIGVIDPCRGGRGNRDKSWWAKTYWSNLNTCECDWIWLNLVKCLSCFEPCTPFDTHHFSRFVLTLTHSANTV